MAIDPSMFGPQSDNPVPFNDFITAYDEGIQAADKQLGEAKERAKSALVAVQAIDPADLTAAASRRAAESELQHASTVVEQASKEATDARTRKGAAIERFSQRGNIPQELKDRYSAMAAVEKAQAQRVQAENFEFLNAIPEKRDQLHAATLKAKAEADLAKTQADVANATTPAQKQAAQAAADLATQNVKNAAANEASIKAGTGATIAQTAQTGAQTDLVRQQARTAKAQADVAPAQAQAAVDQAQANVSKTNQEIADLQRQARQAPTDAQAQQAIQTQITQKQTDLQNAQQQLEQAKKLLPGIVAQQQATLEATQAGTQKGLLGNLYGLQDKAKQIADMIRSGQITDPAQGMAQLQDYIQTTIQGTTPFERNRALLDTETSRRGQDYSLAASKGSAFTSGLSSAMSTFSKLNDTVQPGSDAAGKGFLATMGMLGDRLNSFTPTALPDSPLMQSMRAPVAPVAPAVAPAVAPDTTGGHTININIGGGGAPGQAPAAPLLPAGAAGTNADPSVAGSPAFLSAHAPAMPNHVSDMWASDPNLNPGAMAATGTVDRTSQGRGGM